MHLPICFQRKGRKSEQRGQDQGQGQEVRDQEVETEREGQGLGIEQTGNTSQGGSTENWSSCFPLETYFY